MSEISGSGYSRGGGDKCPDFVPLLWSEPNATDFSGVEITFRLMPQPPREISPGVWFSVDENGYYILDYE